MKETGVVRRIDELGRIVVPKEMRDLFRFEKEVEFVVTNEGVLIRNPKYTLVEKEEK